MFSKLTTLAALSLVSAHKLGHHHKHHHHHLAQQESIPACNSIECKTHSADWKEDPLDKKRNYPVPNFGVDRDILDTHASDKQASAYCAGGGRCGQAWVVAAQQESIPACNSIECKTHSADWKEDPLDKKRNYPVPNFGVDRDILDTHASDKQAGAYCAGGGRCGQPWVVAAQQESIPACNSIECKTHSADWKEDPLDKKRNYPVPNFGVDRDILDTHASDKQAAGYCAGKGARCGQPWVVAAQMEEESIPACNSIECKTHSADWKEDPLDKKRNYPVPNFGVDRDILDTHASDKQAAAYCKGDKARCGQAWVVG